MQLLDDIMRTHRLAMASDSFQEFETKATSEVHVKTLSRPEVIRGERLENIFSFQQEIMDKFTELRNKGIRENEIVDNYGGELLTFVSNLLNKELVNAEASVSHHDVQNYKETFKKTIVNHCKSYNHDLYDEKDLLGFEKMAQSELDAHIESVGLSELDFDSPEDDAKECMSYWE